MDTLHLARAAGLEPEPAAWKIQLALLEFLDNWQRPGRRHLGNARAAPALHSLQGDGLGRFDRAIKDAERYGLEGPRQRWCEVRDAIHRQVCKHGFDARRNTFVQSYDTQYLDASLLLIPQVGFLPPDDPRVRGTVDAIERELLVDGLVLRYSTDTEVDALPPGEGSFLPCSFWLADCLLLIGRRDEGEALFERCSDCATTSDCSPRNTTPPIAACSAIFRRH